MKKLASKALAGYIVASIFREYAVSRLAAIPEADTFYPLTSKLTDWLEAIPFLIG